VLQNVKLLTSTMTSKIICSNVFRTPDSQRILDGYDLVPNTHIRILWKLRCKLKHYKDVLLQ